MKNEHTWHETKYHVTQKKIYPSADVKYLSPASRHMVSLIAKEYEKSFSQHASGDLLDLGCGYAPLYGAYKEYVNTVTCVDWENSLHKNPYLDFEANINERLPFDDEAFDTIILSDVLEHVYSPLNLFMEMRRILRPNGTILLSIPFYYWIHESPYDFFRYTAFGLKYFAEQSDLSIVDIHSFGGPYDILEDMMGKLVLKKTPYTCVLKICRAFFSCIRNSKKGCKFNKDMAERFPLGYFSIFKRLN